jgi:cellulose biosynthesis protein BcsQ
MQQVLKEKFEGLLFDTFIPSSPEADESSQMGEPITRYAPESWMAKAYRRLAEEVLARGNRRAF